MRVGKAVCVRQPDVQKNIELVLPVGLWVLHKL